MPDPQPAVTDEFTDAVGLSQLKAAGGRSTSTARPHGDAAGKVPAPAAPVSPAWPPPPTPDLFKQLVRHLDFMTCQITEMTTGVAVDREPDKYMDEVADQLWPLAHVYGAGADKPTKGVLIMYAVVALAGFATAKYTRWKMRKDGVVSPTTD